MEYQVRLCRRFLVINRRQTWQMFPYHFAQTISDADPLSCRVFLKVCSRRMTQYAPTRSNTLQSIVTSQRYTMLVFLLDCLRFNKLLEILPFVWCNFSNLLKPTAHDACFLAGLLGF